MVAVFAVVESLAAARISLPFCQSSATDRMTNVNPYVPPTSPNDTTTPPVEPPSTWLRNLKAIAIVSTVYSILCATFALTRSAMPETLQLILIALSGTASAWANIQLGPRIGWNQGGLEVVMIVFFVAMAVYFLTALVIGGTVYGIINPVTIYTPFPP